MRVIRFFDCLPFSRAAIPAATVSPAASQKSTGKTACYGPCKIRDAGRRPNRPPGGFSGLRPLAPASPGRPAAGPFLSRAPLLHHLPLPLLYPREVFLERKSTSIADKIAGAKATAFIAKAINRHCKSLALFRLPAVWPQRIPSPLRKGLSFSGQLSHLYTIPEMGICPIFQ